MSMMVWIGRSLLGLLFITALTRELGGSTWLGLTIGAGVVFVCSYSTDTDEGDDA